MTPSNGAGGWRLAEVVRCIDITPPSDFYGGSDDSWEGYHEKNNGYLLRSGISYDRPGPLTLG